MLIDHGFMRWRVVPVLVLCLAGSFGCTKPNPRSCLDGTCTDPAFPFCDLNGEIDGSADTCIAVACEPNTFAACRGDLAITCNATGTDFDLIACERGCEEGTGCRLCDPNETACTNGTVATCDAEGTVVEAEPCPLGCFESEPRCREIDPSNGLGQFMDLVKTPPDIDVTGAIFDMESGEVRVDGNIVFVPSFLVPSTGNGAAIRVFVVGEGRIGDALVRKNSGDVREAPGPAFAIVARGEVRILGTISVATTVGGATSGCTAGQGAAFVDLDDRSVSAGGGGGGNATDGAEGGAVSGVVSPVARATKGLASGNETIVPLRGGCSGGFSFVPNDGSFPTGGGALQLSSAVRVVVEGTLDVRGIAYLEVDQEASYQGGGGAGGSILIEAPEVAFGPVGTLSARGADGAQFCVTATPSCTLGGMAATTTTAATNGGDVSSPGAGNPAASGGGGGGQGRIRINTPTTTFTAQNTSVFDGALTTGALETR